MYQRKPTANITFNGEILRKGRMPYLTASIQI